MPVYILGLAAGLRIFPTFGRSWWVSLLATAAVLILLVPAGAYLLVPAAISGLVIARHVHLRRAAQSAAS